MYLKSQLPMQVPVSLPDLRGARLRLRVRREPLVVPDPLSNGGLRILDHNFITISHKPQDVPDDPKP